MVRHEIGVVDGRAWTFADVARLGFRTFRMHFTPWWSFFRRFSSVTSWLELSRRCFHFGHRLPCGPMAEARLRRPRCAPWEVREGDRTPLGRFRFGMGHRRPVTARWRQKRAFNKTETVGNSCRVEIRCLLTRVQTQREHRRSGA